MTQSPELEMAAAESFMCLPSCIMAFAFGVAAGLILIVGADTYIKWKIKNDKRAP